MIGMSLPGQNLDMDVCQFQPAGQEFARRTVTWIIAAEGTDARHVVIKGWKV